MNEEFLRELLDDVADGVYFLDTDRRITHWSRGAERLTGYRAEDVLGRTCSDNILVHVDFDGHALCDKDTCPAAIALRTGTRQVGRIFLKHRNGYRVPVETVVRPIVDGSGAIVGAAEVFRSLSHAEDVGTRLRELEELALIDPLTGIGNRRLGTKELQDRLHEFERYDWAFGALFIDIDRFKQVNDVHGHLIGDMLLRTTAQALLHNVRSFDSVVRWGGDEFLVLLSHLTREHLLATAHNLRALVAGTHVDHDDFRVRVTVSIGATLALPRDSVESLIRRVDALMYESKRQDGDRVSASDVLPFGTLPAQVAVLP